jgi:hypothetical protein
VKRELKGQVFSSSTALKAEIDRILFSIPSEMLRKTFENWHKRCETVEKNGEYYSA